MDDSKTQTAPASDAAAERLAAFKRGAPTAKPKADPKQKAEPKPKPKAAPKPKADTKPKADPKPRTRSASKPASDEAPKEPKPRSGSRPKAETSSGSRPTTSPQTRSSEDGSSGDGGSTTSGSRRRRGSRGRGGAKAGGTRPEGANESAKPEEPRQGARQGPKADTSGPQEQKSDTADAADAPSSAPRRRRRGGRGRGGSKPAGAATEGGDGQVAETAQTQRDDATPDAPASGSRSSSSRRRRRGSGKGAPAEAASDATAKKARPMSIEEQVASGGPTRGLRSTRSRTGRPNSGGGRGRRRREPIIVPPRITDKLMVITEHGERDQIAVLEEDVLVQHYVTRTGATSMVGNVYLGRVQNVLPGMEAAFVDIGRGRNGVLYAGEVNYRPEDLDGPAPRIEHVLKSGQAVVVQVTKDPMGGKGARLTAQISLPGRFLVFAPAQSVSGISRRLPDEERKRLKSIMRKIKPDGDGVIVRTAAEGASEEAITADLDRLVMQWAEIQKRAKKVKAPAVLYEEPELTLRVVRDLFTDEEYRGLVTDSQRVYDRVMAYVSDVAPDLEPKVTLHTGKLPAFEEHRIVEQIHKALDKKVWLPSGGYLFIERTEAMTIIDVNTGKAVGKTNLEETVKKTNLEAASEVARQLRLRDIGGIIVIDFIDMLLEKNKQQVEDTMREALAIDKTRSQVYEIGPLGLMQVTRKRVSSGLVESFSDTCPTCEGRGILVNYEA